MRASTRWNALHSAARRAAGLVALGAALACAGAAGCGGSGGDDVDAAVDPDECVPGGAFDINGRHAVEATLNVLVNASIIRDKPTTAKVYLLADITTTGVTGNVVGKLCKLEIPPVPLEGQAPLIFTPGPGLIESVKMVSAAGMLGGNTTCSTFKSDVLTVILGADVMPITGLLPQTTTMGAPAPYCAGDLKTDCDPDPTGTNCACDQEKDDKPGSTLIAMNVPGLTDLKEIYAALRTSFALDGQVFSSNEVRGKVTATLDLGILDCLHVPSPTSSFPCTAGDRSALRGFSPTITQNPQNPSTFRTKKVAADMDCAMLVQMIPTLFPR